MDKMTKSPPSRGAWIEIYKWQVTGQHPRKSPPSRGAWIEILFRNLPKSSRKKSPPSRGAWIEIESDFDDDDALFDVAPLAGGVD